MKTTIKRISLLAAASLLLLGTSVITIAASNNASQNSTTSTAQNKAPVSWLFVLQAKEGTLAKGEDGIYTLAVKKSDMVRGIAFSDRPNRLVKHMSQKHMGQLFSEDGVDSFKKDPPNATFAASNRNYVAIGEIISRTIKGDTVTLSIKNLKGSDKLLGTLENIAITIDGACTCPNPVVDSLCNDCR